MQQSVIYQEWKEEFLQEGRKKGREEGRKEGEQLIILRQLNRRVGELSSEIEAKITDLSRERLEALGGALLDFTSLTELEDWLANRDKR